MQCCMATVSASFLLLPPRPLSRRQQQQARLCWRRARLSAMNSSCGGWEYDDKPAGCWGWAEVGGPDWRWGAQLWIASSSSLLLVAGVAYARRWAWLVGLAGLLVATLVHSAACNWSFSELDRAVEEALFMISSKKASRRAMDWPAVRGQLVQLQAMVRAAKASGNADLERMEQGLKSLAAQLMLPCDGVEEFEASDERQEADVDADVDVEVRPALAPQPGKPAESALAAALERAEALVEQGRKALEGGQADLSHGDRLLREASGLLEEAVRSRPASLVALGMQANALLLHGQLKLRAAQRLRALLSSVKSRQEWRQRQQQLEELQGLAQGCERSLVEAGRSYRRALSLRRDDGRALHNWGLALCCRARLISLECDEDEALAEDADKVYLAAIDKFEALVAMGDQHQAAAAALCQWGMAMRGRAHLRPRGSQDRRKLLLQAKELLQGALVRVDGSDEHVQREIRECDSELEEVDMYQQCRDLYTPS